MSEGGAGGERGARDEARVPSREDPIGLSERATAPEGGAGEVVVSVEEVQLSFDSRPVLENISFRLYRGETLCILGGSGVGKSTLLRLILGLTRPDEGRIVVEGIDITSVSFEEVLQIRENIGMVFQESALFDSLSVYDNVAFPLYEHTDLPEELIRERVGVVLRFVDLDPGEVAGLLPAELSGGMKKRVAIARAIAHEPDILLFDEPTSGLDPITTRTINNLIIKLGRELQVSTIVVTHDIESAFRIAHRVALLHRARIAFMGTPREMNEAEDRYVRDFLG